MKQTLVCVSRAEPVQHHLHCQDCRQWICLVLAGVFWCAAVNRLKHRVLITDVAADRQPQSTSGRGAVVADNVPDQVRTDDHVIPFGTPNLPLTEGIYVGIVDANIWKIPLPHFAEHFAEEAVRANDVRLIDARNFVLLVTTSCQIEGVTHHAFGRSARDSYRRYLTVWDRRGLARVSVLGIFANDDIVSLFRLPNLDQLAMDFVLNARIQFHRPDICVQIELPSVENHLSEPCQLWFRIGLARLGENRFAVNLMSNGSEQDRVGPFAFLKRPFGPFDLVLDVVMTAAGNLFDPEVDLKQLARKAQNAQGARQDLRSDSVTGQRYDVIGLFRHCCF